MSDITLLLNVSSLIAGLSETACLLVIITYMFAKIHYKEITNRVSLQLTVALSLTEALFSASIIFNNVYNSPGILCQSGVFLFILTALWSINISTCISINLHCVFVHKSTKLDVVWKYVLISFILALAFSLPPLLLGVYGYDATADSCWFDRKFDITISNLVIISPFKWSLFYLPLIFAIILSAIFSTIVIAKLYKSKKEIKKLSASPEHHRSELMIKQMVTRIIFYPLIPLICSFFNVFGEVVYCFTGVNYFGLLVPAIVGPSIQGLMTSGLFFTVDPAFLKMKERVRVVMMERRCSGVDGNWTVDSGIDRI